MYCKIKEDNTAELWFVYVRDRECECVLHCSIDCWSVKTKAGSAGYGNFSGERQRSFKLRSLRKTPRIDKGFLEVEHEVWKAPNQQHGNW